MGCSVIESVLRVSESQLDEGQRVRGCSVGGFAVILPAEKRPASMNTPVILAKPEWQCGKFQWSAQPARPCRPFCMLQYTTTERDFVNKHNL